MTASNVSLSPSVGTSDAFKILGVGEVVLLWGQKLYPDVQNWGDLIEKVRIFSEPVSGFSFAKSGYKLVNLFCNSTKDKIQSAINTVLEFCTNSGKCFEKGTKFSRWLSKMGVLDVSKKTLEVALFHATVAELISSTTDLATTVITKKDSPLEVTRKSIDMVTAGMAILVLMETGVPLGTAILTCKTMSSALFILGLCSPSKPAVERLSIELAQITVEPAALVDADGYFVLQQIVIDRPHQQ